MTLEELEDDLMQLRRSLEEARNLSRVSLEVLDLLLARSDVLLPNDAIRLAKDIDALLGKPDWKRIDRDSEPVKRLLGMRNALVARYKITTLESPSTGRGEVVSLFDRDKDQ